MTLRSRIWESVRRLIPKYERPGPRYTSYPTAPVWSEEFGEDELRDALARATDRPLSLYIHIPFCERLCTFCACNRTITRDHSVAGPYLDSLEDEARKVAETIGGELSPASSSRSGGHTDVSLGARARAHVRDRRRSLPTTPRCGAQHRGRSPRDPARAARGAGGARLQSHQPRGSGHVPKGAEGHQPGSSRAP